MEQRQGKKNTIRLVFVQVPYNQNGTFPKRKKAEKKTNQQPNYHILILFYKEHYKT